jgi:hypothetical protein
MQQDPMGYVDGPNLYQGLVSSRVNIEAHNVAFFQKAKAGVRLVLLEIRLWDIIGKICNQPGPPRHPNVLTCRLSTLVEARSLRITEHSERSGP